MSTWRKSVLAILQNGNGEKSELKRVCLLRVDVGGRATYPLANLPGAIVDVAVIGGKRAEDLVGVAQVGPLLTLLVAASEGGGGEERHSGQDGVEVELHFELSGVCVVSPWDSLVVSPRDSLVVRQFLLIKNVALLW